MFSSGLMICGGPRPADSDAFVHIGGLQRQMVGFFDYDFGVLHIARHHHAAAIDSSGSDVGIVLWPFQMHDGSIAGPACAHPVS